MPGLTVTAAASSKTSLQYHRQHSEIKSVPAGSPAGVVGGWSPSLSRPAATALYCTCLSFSTDTEEQLSLAVHDIPLSEQGVTAGPLAPTRVLCCVRAKWAVVVFQHMLWRTCNDNVLMQDGSAESQSAGQAAGTAVMPSVNSLHCRDCLQPGGPVS